MFGKKRWVPYLVVFLLWVFIGGPLGSFSGKLASVQENDNAAFLPQSTESTIALNEFTEFVKTEDLPAVVVYFREGGLTKQDKKTIRQLADHLGDVERLDVARLEPPVFSKSGEAAQVVVPLTVTDGEEVLESVGQVKDVVSEDAGDGLEVYVGGQGGVLADFVTAFGSIDGLLLLVTLSVVLIILVLVYKSPILPIAVLFSSVLGLGMASALVYGLAKSDIIDVNGQSQGILFILAVGAATDYALLIVARYREELRENESKYDAMKVAYKGSIEPIVASGVTVMLGLLCLLLSDLTSLKGLGPVGALGVFGAMFSALTFLPAALVLLGRKAFWPFEPDFGSPHPEEKGIWARVSNLVGTHPRRTWAITLVALLGFASFLPTLNEDPIPQTEVFLTKVDSQRAQKILDAQFQSDRSSPAQVVVPVDKLLPAAKLAQEYPGVVSVFPLPELTGAPPAGKPSAPESSDPSKGLPPGFEPAIRDGKAILLVTLADPADSKEATATVKGLRSEFDTVSKDILVGGSTAILLDTRDTVSHDRKLVIPAILIVVFIVLALLLRSLVAPLLLLVANVVSFGATIGIAALVFNYVLDFPGSDPSTLLIGFVFLVALGIDYSIFLMTRVREETFKRGTRPAVLKGLSVTGGVITSAGVVLAATFSALGVLPLMFLAQIAFIVAFGVLLDTIIVRSLLVPALSHDLGARIWWPSKLDRAVPAEEGSDTQEVS